MTLLSDQEISGLIAAQPPLVSDIDPVDFVLKDAPIQASSVDLSVGGIFLPGTPDCEHGGSNKPAESFSLAQGEMAVVQTKEALALPNDIAGFGFPPSRLSIGGLLLTNPGHVDPGYNGKLHLTVINMGRHPISLAAGDAIITLLFIRLASAAVNDYASRRGGRTGGSPVNQALLSRLSKDFLDVNERASAEAKTDMDAFERRQNRKISIISAIGALLFIVIPLVFNWLTTRNDNIGKIESRLNILEKQLGSITELDYLEDRIQALENSSKK